MSIRRHLPPKGRAGYVNLQVKMETSIVEEVRVCMKADEISWNELLTACFRAYLEESRKQTSDAIESVREKITKGHVVSILVGFTALAGLIENPLLQVITDYLV